MKTLLLLLSFASLILSGCATGSAIVTGKARPAIPASEVKLYLEEPEEYEVIGLVESSSAVELSNQAAQDRTIQELKRQASKIGANGVILIHSGDKKGDTYGFYSGNSFHASTEDLKTAKGKAIFATKE